MHKKRQQPQKRDQEFVTESGHLGWIDRTPRGEVVLELSFFSRAKLARENNERIISEWRSYLLPEGSP